MSTGESARERAVSFLRRAKQRWWVFVLAALIPTAFVFAFTRHYKIGLNLDKSIDCRFYLIEKGVMPAKGECVAFRCKDLGPYFPEGFTFIKWLVGTEGDRIETGPDGKDFYINGRFVARARDTDSRGRPVSPMAVLERRVCRGCFFVLGDHPRSYDSRYWGYVHKDQVIGKAVCIY